MEGKEEEQPGEQQHKPEKDSGRGTRNGAGSEGKERGSGEKVAADEERSGEPGGFRRDDRRDGVGRGEREAFFACTRRSHETLGLFLQEVTRQGLHYSLAYQATLDADTGLFVYNENHLPVKVYRITLPQDHCVTSGEDACWARG